MAALKELKERIASVQSTLKITSAMKMVASAKLLRVQSSMVALSEYERRFSDIVAALVSDPDVEVASPLTLEHGEKRRACLVALASDSSLCGAFNANALREAVSVVEELLAGEFSRVTVYPIGEKMVQGMGRYVAARGEKQRNSEAAGSSVPSGEIDLCLDYRHLVGKHSFDGIIPLADRLMEDFLACRCDRVCISRCHFHSMGRQVPMREQLLPFNRVSRANVDPLSPLPIPCWTRCCPRRSALSCTMPCSTASLPRTPPAWSPCRPPRTMPRNSPTTLPLSITSGVSRRLLRSWRILLRPLRADAVLMIC